MTHVIEIENGEDYHAITVRKVVPPTMSQVAQSWALMERAEGVHPSPAQAFQRRFRVAEDSPLHKILDSDQLLADYIATIPEGTPTLKETARRLRRATRPVGP